MFSDGTRQATEENVRGNSVDSNFNYAVDVCIDVNGSPMVEELRFGHHILCSPIHGYDLVFTFLHPVCTGCCERMF